MFGVQPEDQGRPVPRELPGQPQRSQVTYTHPGAPTVTTLGRKGQGWSRPMLQHTPHTGLKYNTDLALSHQSLPLSTLTNNITNYPTNPQAPSNYPFILPQPTLPQTVLIPSKPVSTLPSSIRRIDTGVVEDGELAETQEIPDIELSGLTIYKFRGEDGIPGYIAPANLPIQWSQAGLPPPSVP